MDYPKLIEGNFVEYLQGNLKSCHDTRTKVYSIALNVTIVLVLFLVLGIFFYYKYKEKPTPYEIQQKMYKDQQYILDRIRYYQAQQKNLMTSPIGNL